MKIKLSILILLFLSGCTISKKIQHDVVDFNRALEATSNEIAFLNILRSYKRLPRHYTAITSFTGNLKVTAGAELTSALNPGSIKTTVNESSNSNNLLANATVPASEAFKKTTTIANARNVYTPKLSGSITTNPTYSVNVLESQDFYKGLLNTINIETLALYASQGWDSELLMNLFIESIRFDIPNSGSVILKNDFNDPYWRTLASCITLSSSTQTNKPPSIIDKLELNADNIVGFYNANLILQNCESGSDNKKSCDISGKPQESTVLITKERLVFKNKDKKERQVNSCYDNTAPINLKYLKYRHDPYKINILKGVEKSESEIEISKLVQNLIEKQLSISNFKSPSQNSESAQQLIPQNQIKIMIDNTNDKDGDELNENSVEKATKEIDISVSFSTRSTDAIIYYIGEYLRNVLKNEHCEYENEIKIKGDPMFRICNIDKESGYINVFFDGEMWSIPKDESRSMQILGLLQQLVNLNKSSKDIPKPTFIQVN